MSDNLLPNLNELESYKRYQYMSENSEWPTDAPYIGCISWVEEKYTSTKTYYEIYLQTTDYKTGEVITLHKVVREDILFKTFKINSKQELEKLIGVDAAFEYISFKGWWALNKPSLAMIDKQQKAIHAEQNGKLIDHQAMELAKKEAKREAEEAEEAKARAYFETPEGQQFLARRKALRIQEEREAEERLNRNMQIEEDFRKLIPNLIRPNPNAKPIMMGEIRKWCFDHMNEAVNVINPSNFGHFLKSIFSKEQLYVINREEAISMGLQSQFYYRVDFLHVDVPNSRAEL